MIFIEIPLITVLIIILLIILLGYTLVKAIISNIVLIIGVTIGIITYFALFFLLFRLYRKISKEINNISVWLIYCFSALFFMGFGPYYCLELMDLDTNHAEETGHFFSSLGELYGIRFLFIPIVIVVLFSIIGILLMSRIKLKFIQTLIPIVLVGGFVSFFLYSANICTKSYSDRMTQNMVKEIDELTAVTLNKDVSIYYTGASNKIIFPFLSVKKYSNSKFLGGETVFIDNRPIHNREYYSDELKTDVYNLNPDNEKYIRVTDTHKSGFVLREDIIQYD